MYDPLKDRLGLISWYSQRFFPAEHLPDSPVTPSRVWGLLAAFQRDYNDEVGQPCKGLQFMHSRDRPSSYCGSPLCPTCWHLAQSRLLEHLWGLPAEGHFYIRQTDFRPLGQQLVTQEVDRILSYWTAYKTVGYTLNFWAHYKDRPEVGVPWDGRLTYSVLAVSTATKPTRDIHSDGQGLVRVRKNYRDSQSPFVGEIEHLAYEQDRQLLIDAWMDHLGHPWEYRAHPGFPDYLGYAHQDWSVGRSWTRKRKITS